MSTSLSTPRKRPSEVDENELPVFDDPADLVNAVISTLQLPEERTNVAETYANDRNLATKVQAYAKIAGSDWTFYVKSLEISIGRNTEQSVVGSTGANQAENSIDIDLGPAKVVSRQHATINYNLDLRCWELKVLGRNGARMDGVKIPVGSDHLTQLNSGAILDVGGTQMMFILPDSPPTIHPKMLSKCLQKYKENAQAATKMRRLSNSGLKNFHVYDKTIQSPLAVSATSLQSNLDQDLSHEDAKDIKPPYSYATMITQAILSDSDGVMSLLEIYSWIASHYAYYKYSKTGWQNLIRHNLSLNKAFEKVPRRPNEPGKGMKWQISESYKDDFLTKITNGSLLKNRRGSLVSRQLHLHLATHKNLPELQKKGEDSIELQMIHNREARNTQNIQNQNQNIQNQAQNQNQIQNQSQSQNLQLGQANFTGTFPANFQQNQQQFPPNFQSPQFPIHQRTGSLPKIGPYAANRGAVPQNMINPLAYMQGNQAPQANGFGGMPRYGYQAAAPQWYGPQGDQIQQNINDGELNQNGQMNQNQQMHIPQNQIHQQNHQLNQNLQPNLAANTNGANSIRSPEMDSKSKLGSSSDSSGVISSQVGPSILVSAASTAPLADDSPKKLEAFTPERGSRLNKSLAPHPNQSLPAFWNFVQFSTPNGQTPMRKNSEELTQASPTLSRKVLNERVSSNSASSGQASDELPLKTKDLLDEKKSLST